MTLGDLFVWIGEHPIEMCTFYLGMPLVALLLNFIASNEGHLNPWKYVYSVLIYAVCIPGILAVTLNVYYFLFERRSITDANLFVQIIPILTMLATLYIIKKNVEYCDIPGFDKISGLMFVIFGVICFMWILERTHIIAISIVPFYYVLLIFLALLLVIRFGLKTFLR